MNKFKDSPFGSQASDPSQASKLPLKPPVKAPATSTTSPFQKKVGENTTANKNASPFGESKDKPANPFGAKLNPPKVEQKPEPAKDDAGEDGKSVNKLKGLWK